MKKALLPAGIGLLSALAAMPAQAEQVRIDAPDGTALVAYWMPKPEGGIAPAVLALHGCGGLFDRTGSAFDPRYPEYVDRLHAAGYHVLLPDSFGPRGRRSICTVPARERTITVETRRGDALAALDWLARRDDVDPRRIVMLGWSHGGSTTLSAINATRPTFARNLAGAIVFYPGCSAFLREPYRLQAPTLMLLGGQDDWTPPERCVQLADRVRAEPGVELRLQLYPEGHHGFDSTRPLRFWPDVPNGPDRKGVHTGGNPEARAAALREVDAFLAARRSLGHEAANRTVNLIAPAIR